MVGVIIGLILVGLNSLFKLFLPSPVVHVLLVVASAVISGAMHLDGFVDTCDGIGGHKTPEERWQVMKDSRVGAFGIVGVCCLLLVKYVSLDSLPGTLMMTTLLLMPTLSRWAMAYAVFLYPYAKPSGLGRVLKQEARWHRFLMATLIALAVAVVAARLAGFAIMIGIWVIVVATAAYLKRKFSGLTGDSYGAINEVAEVCVLVFVCLLAHIGLA